MGLRLEPRSSRLAKYKLMKVRTFSSFVISAIIEYPVLNVALTTVALVNPGLFDDPGAEFSRFSMIAQQQQNSGIKTLDFNFKNSITQSLVFVELGSWPSASA